MCAKYMYGAVPKARGGVQVVKMSININWKTLGVQLYLLILIPVKFYDYDTECAITLTECVTKFLEAISTKSRAISVLHLKDGNKKTPDVTL